ncbi:uncharacterized protein LOC141774647 isoform X2 [Sebastes fasciatus]|uniref:uncharacterized protein LOC141774647 isoform X2 n=1 Tax=Sebastes fasciatus TaxID=394691 RepID=UPI003D9F4F7D
MKIFLLLLLPLMTGCGDTPCVKGCRKGWVEFICEYPQKYKTYKSVAVVKDQTLIQSTEENVWESNDRYSVYNDKKKNNVRVAIRQLQRQDSGKYKCVFKPGSSKEKMKRKVKLKVEKNECQEPFIQTAYRTAKTTISCRYKGKSTVSKFYCKDNGSICENIVSTRSSLRSNGTFILTESSSSFSMSISNVSSQHAGVYWCGVERKGGCNRAALRNITLKVEATITNFTRSPTIGQNFTYWCDYSGQPDIKFICKGEDPSICEPLVTTKQNTGRFSMEDDKKKKITITVRDVTSEDTGTYWCGAKTSDTTRSNPFFHRLVMTVVPPTTPSIISSAPPHPVTSSVSSTQSTTASAESSGDGESWVTVVVAVVVCVAFLVLLIILVLSYKRFQRSKNTRIGELPNNEDRAYDEIQVPAQKPGAGTALQTIYVTANAPTIPSVPQYYSTVNFHTGSGEAGDDTYSTVKDNDQSPAYSTVNHPSRLPEDPFYSTVNKPQ